MTATEIKICEATLRDGTIISEKDYKTSEGIAVKQYIVEEDGEEYMITKNGGEFVYFSHTIR